MKGALSLFGSPLFAWEIKTVNEHKELENPSLTLLWAFIVMNRKGCPIDRYGRCHLVGNHG